MIQIDETISTAVPSAVLGVLTCSAVVAESSADLLADFDDTVKAMQDDYTLEKVAQNPHVAATRKAYKALGKDPLKYRNSAEAMLRRIANGNGLYRINNAVDINNMVSVASAVFTGVLRLCGNQRANRVEARPRRRKIQGYRQRCPEYRTLARFVR